MQEIQIKLYFSLALAILLVMCLQLIWYPLALNQTKNRLHSTLFLAIAPVSLYWEGNPSKISKYYLENLYIDIFCLQLH